MRFFASSGLKDSLSFILTEKKTGRLQNSTNWDVSEWKKDLFPLGEIVAIHGQYGETRANAGRDLAGRRQHAANRMLNERLRTCC